MRDPRIDPVVGDAFMLAAGAEWRVLDLFIAVDYETGKRRGVYIEIEDGARVRRTCLALEQFRREVRGARLRLKTLGTTDWARVPIIAAPLVCAAMAAGLWPPGGPTGGSASSAD